jgi:hypothetical protein
VKLQRRRSSIAIARRNRGDNRGMFLQCHRAAAFGGQ